jgi:hypothetical protein
VTTDDARSWERTPCGSYLFRFGPPGKGAPHSKKKVCLVATDAPFLVSLLEQLASRADCYFVKHSTFTRDGMVLGRVFMTSDGAAGRLCQELKGHAKLFASIQDDEFFAAFREADG